MANVYDVAEYFRYRSYLDGKELTHLKLQKLVYYAQAWYVTFFPNNGTFFDENIEAWVHGPVCRDLYFVYRDYGYRPIDPVRDFDTNIFTNEELEVLETVWESYGEYDGKYLEALTHSEDPWILSRNRSNMYSSEIIPIENMRNYYNRLLSYKF